MWRRHLPPLRPGVFLSSGENQNPHPVAQNATRMGYPRNFHPLSVLATYFDPRLWSARRLRSTGRAEIELAMTASVVRSGGFFPRPAYRDLSARNRRPGLPGKPPPLLLSPQHRDAPREHQGYGPGIA